MREKITGGETSFRRAYLRAVVEAIEVDDRVIRIHGSKTSLEQAVVAGEQIGKGVRGFIRKWRARRDSNPWPLPSEGIAGEYSPLFQRFLSYANALITRLFHDPFCCSAFPGYSHVSDFVVTLR
jgi:hypothetical protein